MELVGQVKRQLVSILLHSSATTNFITDQIVAALHLKVVPKPQFDELMLANSSVVKAAGYVQF